MKRISWSSCTVLALLLGTTLVRLGAHQSSGAIFTSMADGSAVNFNIYDAKEDVYLDGGPGDGAPQHAAGLDDGVYVLPVTDPSGKTLLSTDIAECRQFTVTNGVIASTAPSSCPHVIGADEDHGATTVQLMPFQMTRQTLAACPRCGSPTSMTFWRRATQTVS